MIKLIGYEIRKLLGHFWVPLLLIGGLIVANYRYVDIYMFAPGNYQYGREFYNEYGGTLNREKYEAIKKLKNVTHEGMHMSFEQMYYYDAMEQIDYMTGYRALHQEILDTAMKNVERYEAIGSRYKQKVNQIILNRYQERAAVQLVDVKQWTNYLSYHWWLITPMCLITLLLCIIFTNEKEYGCAPVLTATATGRRQLFWVKLAAAALTAFGVMLLFVLVRLAVYGSLFPLTNWDAAVQSLPQFAKCQYSVSLGQMVLFCGLLQCVAAMIHGILVALLSSLFARNMSGLIAGGIWYLGSFLWYCMLLYEGRAIGISIENHSVVSLLQFFRHFFYIMLLEPQEYFRKLELVNVFGCPMPLLWLCIGISTAILTVSSVAAYRFHLRDCR